jgi:hypothetical protein
MSAIPLARYLVDFSRDVDAGKGRLKPQGDAESVRRHALEQDQAVRITESHARGLQEGRAAAEAAIAGHLEAQRESLDRKHTADRAAWAAQEGEALAQRLTAGLADIAGKTSQTVASILTPFVNAELRRTAVSELLVALETVLSKSNGTAIEISGPADLLAVVREKLGQRHARVSFVTRDVPDVRVTVDQTVLETCVGDWLRTLEGGGR